MNRRYWAPLLAVAVAIGILVPSTFAKGQAGDTFGVAFGPNRFPGGLDRAAVNLTFETDSRVRLDVTVQGSDVRSWQIRIYDKGNCQRPSEWVVARPGTNGAGQTVPLRLTTNTSLSVFLDPDDVTRLLNVPDNRNLAFLFAGSGAGQLGSGSPYRTCALFGGGPVNTTTSTTSTTSSSTSVGSTNTTNTTITSATPACVTTRTIPGTISTTVATTATLNNTVTIPGTVSTIQPGTTATIGGQTFTTDLVTTINSTATTLTGTVITVPGTVTTISPVVTTGSGTVTTVPVTTVTVTPGTSTSFGTVTTATGTVTTISGTATCAFP